MEKSDTVLIIAFKYNDILYGVNTTEYINSKEGNWLFFFLISINPNHYPLQCLFDDILYISYTDNVKMMYKNIINVYKFRNFWRADVIMMCNPLLLIVKLIAKLSKATKAVWLEDGLMNYYPLKDIPITSPSALKVMVQRILCVSDIEKTGKELVTYLLAPEYAESYWGTIKKINIKSNILDLLPVERCSIINGKKIFIGQTIYLDGVITIEEYNRIVNKFIDEYHIDFYISHFFSSPDECINCQKLFLSDMRVTMEFVACRYSFDLYSFSSTLLYSTKLLNTNISTNMIKINGVDKNLPILNNIVDNVIEL